jgi:hypothetical protein
MGSRPCDTQRGTDIRMTQSRRGGRREGRTEGGAAEEGTGREMETCETRMREEHYLEPRATYAKG